MSYQKVKERLEVRAWILEQIDRNRVAKGNPHLFRAAEFQMLKREYQDMMQATELAEAEA